MTPLELFQQFLDSLGQDFLNTYVYSYDYKEQRFFEIRERCGDRTFQICFDLKDGKKKWHDLSYEAV